MATETIKFEVEALLLIECVTEHTIKNEATDQSLDSLLGKISDLLEDIIARENESKD